MRFETVSDDGNQIAQALLAAALEAATSALANFRRGAVERLLARCARGERSLVVRVFVGDSARLELALSSPRSELARLVWRMDAWNQLAAGGDKLLNASLGAIAQFRKHAPPGVVRGLDRAILSGADLWITIVLQVAGPTLRGDIRGPDGRLVNLFTVAAESGATAIH